MKCSLPLFFFFVISQFVIEINLFFVFDSVAPLGTLKNLGEPQESFEVILEKFHILLIQNLILYSWCGRRLDMVSFIAF